VDPRQRRQPDVTLFQVTEPALAEPPEVLLFADGSCSGNPGPGGWGCILRHVTTGREKELSGGHRATTNNQMELTAVIEGLKAIDAGRPRRIHVVTDSQYVVQGMTVWIHGWIAHRWRRGRSGPPVKNVELWKALHALAARHQVTFEHVRGHAGHPENERCDELATAATRRAMMRKALNEE